MIYQLGKYARASSYIYISSPYKHVYVIMQYAIDGMQPISKVMLATYLW